MPATTSIASAGIWQFIPRPRGPLGCAWKGSWIERLDTALLTDAAARMLRADQLRFADWQLALLAFNMGSQRPAGRHRRPRQSRCVGADSRRAEGDPGYLARVHAAVLIAANPEAVAP